MSMLASAHRAPMSAALVPAHQVLLRNHPPLALVCPLTYAQMTLTEVCREGFSTPEVSSPSTAAQSTAQGTPSSAVPSNQPSSFSTPRPSATLSLSAARQTVIGTLQPGVPRPTSVTVATVSLEPLTTTSTTAPGVASSWLPSSSPIFLSPSSSIAGVMIIPPFYPFTIEATISTTPSTSVTSSVPSSSTLSVIHSTNNPVETPTTSLPTTLTGTPSSVSSALPESMPSVFSVTLPPPTISSPFPTSTISLPPTDSAPTAPSLASPSVSVTPYPSEAAAQTPKLTATLIAIITMLSFLALMSLLLGICMFTRTRRQRLARIQRQRESETRSLSTDSMHLVTPYVYGGTQSIDPISPGLAPPRPQNPYEGIIPPHTPLLPSYPEDNRIMRLAVSSPRPRTASR
ncbi:hypothetical protein BDN67DRAFT_1065153 [Paxillus ammoniavirescens]|nr:hypothetical protein BDN67DRAFT_1065153 [Paxillus ammoniavirescens]